jgi:hypothetical protein
MIYNQHLEKLLEIPLVQAFMQNQKMKGKTFTDNTDSGLLIHRFPYVVCFHETLRDSSLDIYLVDIKANQMLYASTALGICLDMGLQDIAKLRELDFRNDPKNSVFLSAGSSKMLSLHTDLDALGKLLPIIEEKGGLISMKDGRFDKKFDFSRDVLTPPAGLSEELLRHIED